jgi:hypothetical protein
MKQHFFLPLFILLIGATLSSCGAHQQTLSPVAMKAGKTKLVLHQLIERYEKKDENLFLSSLHPELKGSSLSKEAISYDFRTFSEIKMRVEPTRIEIANDSAFIESYWEAVWTANASPPIRQSGRALFIFSGEESPQLLEIRGESPFGLFQRKE